MSASVPPPASRTTLYDIPAPAKLNLFLHVVGRRPDGYHLLQTAFRFVSLCDHLGMERRADGQIVRQGASLPGLSADEDLVVRAARLLQQATGTSHGATIHYDKRIPAGAGLGGGSSNAASTLLALNRLWHTGLRRHQLQELAARLGADVPVFVYGQGAFAQGTGDELESLHYPDTHYVLIHPSISMTTASVFASEHLTRDTKPLTITDFTKWLAGHCQGDFFGQNNLQAAAYLLQPQLAQLQKWLAGVGVNARMTGSGSSFFVPCDKAAQAAMLKQKILGKINSRESVAKQAIRQISVCHGLNDHPLKYWVNN